MLLNQMKSTKNARHWLILTTSLLLTINLTGCASWFKKEPEVNVVSRPVDKTPLALAMPAPLSVKPVEWTVINKENAEKIFKELESKGQQPVLIALTPNGYEQLSISFAEIRNLISTQRNIIIKYKDYYENVKEEPAKKEETKKPNWWEKTMPSWLGGTETKNTNK